MRKEDLMLYGYYFACCRDGIADEEKARKKKEIEVVLGMVADEETRYAVQLYCLGYSYADIVDIFAGHGLYTTYNTVKSKIRRTFRKLEKKGVLYSG